DSLSGNIAAGPGSIFDNKLLGESLRQPLSNKPRRNVDPTPRCKANNDPHWSRGIGLCTRDMRSERQRGSARGQMQKLPTVGKFHELSFSQKIIVGGVTRTRP